MKINGKVQGFVDSVIAQFNARTVTEGKKHGYVHDIVLNVELNDNMIWLNFTKSNESHIITVPVPYEEDGVHLLSQNGVTRALCPFWIEKSQIEVDFMAAMYMVIVDKAEGFVSPELVKVTPYLQQMIYGFNNGNAAVVAHKLQKAVNEVVNKMPLHETAMNSYVMNSRIIVIDRDFDELTSPDQRLAYQVGKAKKYFDKGWTSIGLSDGTLADKNYILKRDLRALSPFGVRFHNPQRNLYSTLGMKGDELPIIRSESMQDLMDKGVTRKGWNWFTAFVDIPDVFEDQIVVDISHADKFVTYDKRIQVFGDATVKKGDTLKTGDVVGIAKDDVPFIFDNACDHAVVTDVTESLVAVGSEKEKIFNVLITYKRYFIDGFKLTNLHGNKGVIRLMDLGYAIHPVTGLRTKIDVIVGAKTIGKRKNYGQVMEALTNCLTDIDRVPSPWDYARLAIGKEVSKAKQPLVIADDWFQPLDQVKAGLERRGFNKGCTWECDTYVGKLNAVCGTVFWGCIKTPHDQLWKENATASTNGKEVRTAGLKFSHIEFRAIDTQFGSESPIMDEIMGYSQGASSLTELLEMLKAKKGEYNGDKQTYDMASVKAIDNTLGTIVDKVYIDGTVVDGEFLKSGFLLRLPLPYQTLVHTHGDIVHEGAVLTPNDLPQDVASSVTREYVADRIYLPEGLLRACWRHPSGKFGLSEIGVVVNNVVSMSHRLMANPNDPSNYRLYYGAIKSFFAKITGMVSGKNGEISNSTMSVRYPFSAKATATLSTTLPKNTVEIHRSMAKILKVNNGDVVLVERFPCLGFVSVRCQKVRITDDPMCKYTIRASGNSLVSTNLDFDGDVIYLASFHTLEAKKALFDSWTNPNKTCYAEIDRLNNRKGAPHIKEYTFDDFGITPFEDMTNDSHAAIVEKNTGVKAQTGPVIALTYNIMRITEDSDIGKDLKTKVAIEMFVEKAAQSVFEQKHGGRSLHEIVIDGICTGDAKSLIDAGFKRGITEALCNLIKTRAAAMNVFDLVAFHEKAKEKGTSNIISKIVKHGNKIYHASRSSKIECIDLLEAIEAPAVDIPSKMYKWAMAGNADRLKTPFEEMWETKKLKGLTIFDRDVCSTLFEAVDAMIYKEKSIVMTAGR